MLCSSKEGKMSAQESENTTVSKEAQAAVNRHFGPTNPFTEFENEEIVQSIPEGCDHFPEEGLLSRLGKDVVQRGVVGRGLGGDGPHKGNQSLAQPAK